MCSSSSSSSKLAANCESCVVEVVKGLNKQRVTHGERFVEVITCQFTALLLRAIISLFSANCFRRRGKLNLEEAASQPRPDSTCVVTNLQIDVLQ